MKKAKIVISIILLLVICIAIGYYVVQKTMYVSVNTASTEINVEYSQAELSGEWKSYTAKITLNDENTVIEGSGVTVNSNKITISKAGTYYITGSISDGSIVVNATKNDEVQLVLDNCEITSKTTSAINGIKASKLTVTLMENSTNTLTDASTYQEFTDTEKQEPDGALFTKTDLVINGEGTLIVNANYQDGIVSKDGLKIINSNLQINSADDGIRGKDYVAINNANITINAEGDGIKSTNDTDTSLGYIVIEGGKIEITANQDGIQAETILNISQNSEIEITTQGEIASKTSSNNMGFKGGFGSTTSTTTTSSETKSSKGIKAGNEITIEKATLKISSTDDSIHSNGKIIINDGEFSLSSGDDGIHADTSIVINDGNINITKSYEGIESSYIEINGGTIKLIASDDGINICGGNDTSSMNGRPGQNNFSNVTDSNRKLVINGGDITVNSTGDGLDSNGSIYINGGKIVVEGPTSSADGALDYDSECVVTGGELIIYGSTGMWQNPSTNSTQYTLTFNRTGSSGETVVLKDSEGNEIASVVTTKSYSAIGFSSEKIQKGESYTLYVNDQEISTLEASNIVTSNSSNQGMNGMGGMKGNKDMQGMDNSKMAPNEQKNMKDR